LRRFNIRLAGRVYFLVILFDLFMVYWSPFDPIGRGGALAYAIQALVTLLPNWAGFTACIVTDTWFPRGKSLVFDFTVYYVTSAMTWAVIAGFMFRSERPDTRLDTGSSDQGLVRWS
jgi:hypothetical protein